MTRVNTAYNMANVKEARKGGENTFEIYPVFKGCWDFKYDGIQYGEEWWKNATCGTGYIFEWGRTKIGYGKLRLY